MGDVDLARFAVRAAEAGDLRHLDSGALEERSLTLDRHVGLPYTPRIAMSYTTAVPPALLVILMMSPVVAVTVQPATELFVRSITLPGRIAYVAVTGLRIGTCAASLPNTTLFVFAAAALM